MKMNCAKYCVFFMCTAISAFSEATNDTSLESCRQQATWPVYMDFATEAIVKAKNISATCHDTAGKWVQKETLMSYLAVADDMINKANDTSLENCSQQATWTVYMDFAADAIVKAKSASVTCPDTVGNCKQKETLMSYLAVADDMINKAKINIPPCDSCNISMEPQEAFRDCRDLLHAGHNSSGVYTISPINRLTENKSVDVYCDMDTDGGGWTVIQRRGDFKNPIDYFYKDWKSYKEGFGDVEEEFWLGNDNIFALTNQGIYSVRFDLKDGQNNTRYAHYDAFWIDDESSKYTLHISKYSGDAGDSMMFHNNLKFTTKDQDNDHYKDGNCAKHRKGAWWFRNCFQAHLNGENLKGKQSRSNYGVIWEDWKGNDYSLASTEIKIRPKNFRA